MIIIDVYVHINCTKHVFILIQNTPHCIIILKYCLAEKVSLSLSFGKMRMPHSLSLFHPFPNQLIDKNFVICLIEDSTAQFLLDWIYYALRELCPLSHSSRTRLMLFWWFAPAIEANSNIKPLMSESRLYLI